MREGIGFGRSPKAASRQGPLCQAIEARTCVSANEGIRLIIFAPHALFREAGGYRLAGAIVEENGRAIEPPQWTELDVADLSYIMPTERPFEPHADYDPRDPRFDSDKVCRLDA
jgi:hypothetical protein